MRTKLAALTFAIVVAQSACTDNNHSIKHLHSSEHKHSSEHNEENVMKISKPNRVTHTYEQTINGTIDEIFSLYCPVREVEWCDGWNPKVVYSTSGVVEPDCIFITEHGGHETAWFVTVYDIEQGRVEMIHHTPGVIFTKLEISVAAISDSKSKAVITYSKTSLSEHGDKALAGFTKEYYDIMMDSWEKAMNHFLKTGEMLTGLPNF